jgi:hypothetical protein
VRQKRLKMPFVTGIMAEEENHARIDDKGHSKVSIELELGVDRFSITYPEKAYSNKVEWVFWGMFFYNTNNNLDCCRSRTHHSCNAAHFDQRTLQNTSHLKNHRHHTRAYANTLVLIHSVIVGCVVHCFRFFCNKRINITQQTNILYCQVRFGFMKVVNEPLLSIRAILQRQHKV